MSKPKVIWKPFPGAQRKFLSCPVWECLIWGNRGGGKTDVLVMDFLSGVGVGYGADYNGLILREATTELGDIIKKTRKWIPQIFPTAKFNKSLKIWTFEDGESLWLNYARTEDDYDQYHGHEYAFIGWEELTNQVFSSIYLKLMSCNRTSNPAITLKYRATCNTAGPGMGWVKERFIDVGKVGKIYTDEEGQKRTHIQSFLDENEALLLADPAYKAKLMTLTADDDVLRKSWVHGSWNLLIGGFFSSVWDKKIHILPDFIPPKSWRLVRSFDWGSTKPWAVTYGLVCNGEQPEEQGLPYFPKDSVIICNEIYGWTGKINEGDEATSQEIAERVLAVDNSMLTEYGIKCVPGPADTQIWEVRDGSSIAQNLRTHGCYWTKAYKGSGSRVAGWTLMRQMFGAAKRLERETPHLYLLERAQHHIRTIPMLPRDKTKPEDVDTDAEDHCGDSTRYLLARKLLRLTRRKVGV